MPGVLIKKHKQTKNKNLQIEVQTNKTDQTIKSYSIIIAISFHQSPEFRLKYSYSYNFFHIFKDYFAQSTSYFKRIIRFILFLSQKNIIETFLGIKK